MTQDSEGDSVPDWVKNLFKDFESDDDRIYNFEFKDAHDWAKSIIDEAKRKNYRDPYWLEFPLIQREARFLKGDHLLLYKAIRLNPTFHLSDLFLLLSLQSGLDEDKFYNTINELIESKYVKLFSVYYSFDYTLRQPQCNFIKECVV